jgi:hypothetical protein
MPSFKVTVTLALFLGFISAEDVNRELQALPPPPPPPAPARVLTSTPLRFYGDDYIIPYASTLGCGACINSGAIYCV